MASTNLYKSLGKTETKVNREGGYKGVIYYAPLDTFASIKTPVVGATPALGDSKKITTAHTFNADEGFISLLCKKHSVTSDGEDVGEDGAKSMQWTFKGVILGDSASHQEQLEAQLNEESIWLIKDQDCTGTDYVQFGDACTSVDIKLKFTGKTTKEGLKEYEITGTVKAKKFWYSATVTEKP